MRRSRVAAPLLTVLVAAALLALTLSHLPHASDAPTAAPTAPSASTSTDGTIDGATAPLLVDAGLATADPDGSVHVDAAATLAALAKLPSSTVTVSGYDRDAFGQAWADVDRNGCDTRNDVLRRDLVDVQLKPGTHDCVVLAGTLHDPYTGQTIAFVRGQGTSEAVQIDHIWPLGLVWSHGASTWSPQQRQAFANDPAELLAVDGSANASKSDSGPGTWLPPAADDRCAYVARFTYVAVKYTLTVSPADRDAISGVLASCD